MGNNLLVPEPRRTVHPLPEGRARGADGVQNKAIDGVGVDDARKNDDGADGEEDD